MHWLFCGLRCWLGFKALIFVFLFEFIWISVIKCLPTPVIQLSCVFFVSLADLAELSQGVLCVFNRERTKVLWLVLAKAWLFVIKRVDMGLASGYLLGKSALFRRSVEINSRVLKGNSNGGASISAASFKDSAVDVFALWMAVTSQLHPKCLKYMLCHLNSPQPPTFY